MAALSMLTLKSARSVMSVLAVLVFLSGCAVVEPEPVLQNDEESVEEIDVAELDAALGRLIKDLEAAIEATKAADKDSKEALLAEDGTYLVLSLIHI